MPVTDETMLPPLPAPPDPTKVALYTSDALTALKLLSGAGIISGAWVSSVSTDRVSALISVGLYVFGAAGAIGGWLATRWRVHKAAADARKTAVASAAASVKLGAPVIVTETPPGQPNVATLISATEQAAAPSVPTDVPPTPAQRGL